MPAVKKLLVVVQSVLLRINDLEAANTIFLHVTDDAT